VAVQRGRFGVWDGPVRCSQRYSAMRRRVAWVSSPEVSEDRDVPSASDRAAREVLPRRRERELRRNSATVSRHRLESEPLIRIKHGIMNKLTPLSGALEKS